MNEELLPNSMIPPSLLIGREGTVADSECGGVISCLHGTTTFICIIGCEDTDADNE